MSTRTVAISSAGLMAHGPAVPPPVLRPAPLPRQLAVSNVAEMEPGERAWCSICAVQVDNAGRVWIDAEFAVVAEECEGCDVAVRRVPDGMELGIPNCYRLPRRLQMDARFLMPAVKVEVREDA